MGSQTFRTSPTCLTSLIRPRAHADSCSFASFVPFRGLKTSIEFLFFSSHETHKAAHERERANNIPFSRANTIRLSVDFLIASADSIRKSVSAIRLLTERIMQFFIKKDRKKVSISRNLHLSQNFWDITNEESSSGTMTVAEKG